MKLPEGWQNAPMLTGALVAFGLAAWLFSASDQGQLVAAALLVIGSVLVGALLVDWAQRDPGDAEVDQVGTSQIGFTADDDDRE